MDGLFDGGSGAFGVRERREKRVASKPQTMKALAFTRPYPTMLRKELSNRRYAGEDTQSAMELSAGRF